MNAKTLSKILGALLTGAAIVIWWFVQSQVANNVDTDKRIDALSTQVQTLQDWKQDQEGQTHMLWQRIREDERK